MSDIAQLFGARADVYANFRPVYPSALFDWLAAHSPGRDLALDIACGNGQASHPLLPHFDTVLACDASVEQLAQGRPAAGLYLLAAEARKQPIKKVIKDLQRGNRIRSIRHSLLIGRTIDFLVEHAKVTEVSDAELEATEQP